MRSRRTMDMQAEQVRHCENDSEMKRRRQPDAREEGHQDGRGHGRRRRVATTARRSRLSQQTQTLEVKAT